MNFTAVTPNQNRGGFHDFGTNKVVGVIDDVAKVDAARAALTSIGITDAMIEVFCGLEGERNLDLKGESHGFVDHISRIYEHIRLVDGSHMDRYEKELLAGHCVIQVYTGDSETREQAKDLLKASGGHFINAYTAWTTEVLVPSDLLQGPPAMTSLIINRGPSSPDRRLWRWQLGEIVCNSSLPRPSVMTPLSEVFLPRTIVCFNIIDLEPYGSSS